MSPVVKILQPSGTIDAIKGNQLRRDINDMMETKPDIVLIDLQDVTFMDSSGLGALLSAFKTVRSAGGKLYICSVNDQVRMLFELTRMDRVLEKFANRDEFNQQVLGTT